MDFAEYLGNSDVSENSKAYYSQFLQNGLHERYVILLKVDKMYNILKSLLATVISRDMKVKLDDQSF